MIRICSLLLFVCLFAYSLPIEGAVSLRNNLQKAQKGDFVVTSQHKNYTLLHVYEKTPESLTIEEITIPIAYVPKQFSWREWVRQGAPNHTSWLLYAISLSTGDILECFSVSHRSWLNLSRSESFLPTLLNLQLTPVPDSQLRRVGPPPAADAIDRRPYWQPQMVVNGNVIPGVKFEAWRTQWPSDDSELSRKFIDIYLPLESEKYPAYFPYWLQVYGAIGKASMRIIDSGTNLVSPASPIPKKL